MDAYNQVIQGGEALAIDEARQMKDPKKDSMVQKGGKTIVIDKSKEKEYLKKGWSLAEKKKLDPVDDAENDKKFKDRKDKDIDNDGDVDSSDEYLHKKRAATDDAIDGGKKPAKKEEDEDEGDDEEEKEEPKVAGKKDDKKKVASNAKTPEISKIGEDIDFTDATTDLLKMWESAAKKSVKGATDKGEEIDSKDSPKAKEFTAAHKKSDKKIEDNEEDGHDKTFKAQGGTTPKSGKRPQDNATGDTKVVKSTEVKEDFNPAGAIMLSYLAALTPLFYMSGKAMVADLKALKAKSAKKGFKPSKEDKSLLQKFLAIVKRKKPDAVKDAEKKANVNESVELDEGVSKTYKGNTIHQVGKHRSSDDKVAYKLSNADAKILNKFMKSASAKERTQMHNMFWDTDEKDTDNVTAAKGPKMAIAYAKKNINEDTTQDIIAQAQDIINGKTVSEIADLSSDKPKNPHDARTREARAFLERMAKRRGYK